MCSGRARLRRLLLAGRGRLHPGGKSMAACESAIEFRHASQLRGRSAEALAQRARAELPHRSMHR